MDRRRLVTIGAVILGAIATQLLVWLIRPVDEPPPFVGPPRSDYTLADFELNALDEQGRLAFTVTAPTLARRNDDGSLWVETPQFRLSGKDGDNWKGRSQTAWVTKDGTRMLLGGEVEMHRDTTDVARYARLETRDVTAYPKDRKLETQAPATITQPGSILRGTGMKADLETHQLELLADVHASFARPRKP
ncbi:LPS export ABC transporter periplasmic protein LptC [Tahibacter amnicola]|uniref:LPS export ABC transporter periplasmic protein LptC n=1 Tax=Tahibacter amnicola TaxID=2976241 RepID=A0ABY6BGJ7_9GAMM|nr:LPS export ABC transporter periplasmic protein LptC [Tahibacter amnicola]UXI67495.1 LPS export ABC transporter periplasmic protein LptC [Tahibacter amnicola]